MNAKKKRLGRGLDALLSRPLNQPSETAAGEAAEAGQQATQGPPGKAGEPLREIPVDQLQRGQYQPRLDIRQDSLEDLANSIKAQGVVQPIVARPLPASDGRRRYEIIAGERRWRAAQMAGLDAVPTIVREVPDEAAIAMALIENIQRENLNPLEEARALDRLIREFDLTHAEAAEAVGRSRAAVSNLLRLQELADRVKPMLEARELEMGHARALLAIADASEQLDAARQVVKKGLSVRETEKLVRRILDKAASGRKKRPDGSGDADIRRLETEVSEKIGAKVRLAHTKKGSGKLVISYNSLDELDGILKHIR